MIEKIIGNKNPKRERKRNLLESRADSLVDSDRERLRNGGVIQMYPALLAAAAVRAATVVGGKSESSDDPIELDSANEGLSPNMSIDELIKMRKGST